MITLFPWMWKVKKYFGLNFGVGRAEVEDYKIGELGEYDKT